MDWMLGRPSSPLRVLDLGAGTGLGTRTIAGLGHQATAVDPSTEMLAALEASAATLPGGAGTRIATVVARGEHLPVADASYDALTCFQAWHWIDPDLAGPECSRVLRVDGLMSLAWNSWSDREPWLRELADMVGTPEMVWDPERRGAPTADPGERIDGFDPPENTQFSTEQTLTVDQLVRLASSWSLVAVSPDRFSLLDRVRALGTEVAGSEAILTFSYVSDCWRYARAQ